MSTSAGDLDIDDFIRLETSVWEALVRGDAAADRRLLSSDFLGVYPVGFANRDDHVGQLGNGPTVADFRLSGERLFVISNTAVVLAYRADYRKVAQPGSPEPEPEPEAMYVSSIWCERDGEWVNVFSQDTPVSAEAVP